MKLQPRKQDKTLTTIVKLKFKIESDADFIKIIDDKVTLAMSTNSKGLYTIGEDVEKYCGIPEKDVIKEVDAGKEKPEDAIIYGMTNIMNNGEDIYFWTNGTRLAGRSKQIGLWPAIMEQVSHESTHIARVILTRAIAKEKGININGPDWITYDYGAGKYNWPAVGDLNKKNKLIQIDEESFASTLGLIVEKITPEFIKLANSFLSKGMILKKYQNGDKLEGPEFIYSGRPNSVYRKDTEGDWYIKNSSTHDKFIRIDDPTGVRTGVLNAQAKVRSTTLKNPNSAYGNFFGSGAADSAPTKGPNVEGEYLEKLKELENGIKAGYKNGVWTPHNSVEGGSDTIAYGHKLQKGENFSKGLTEKEAHALLQKDYATHKSRAQEHVDSKYGTGTFAKLTPHQQVLLTDYEYNVGLSKFPSFVKGVVTKDKNLMLKEYKRYTGSGELKSRNEWALGMINKMCNGGILYRK